MMPNSVTQFDLERWKNKFNATEEMAEIINLKNALPGFTIPSLEEVHLSGCWLEERLSIEGASKDEIEAVVRANGQKTVFAHIEQKDAWDIANETLKAYRNGNWDRPGPKLAKQLNDKFIRIVMDNSQRRN